MEENLGGDENFVCYFRAGELGGGLWALSPLQRLTCDELRGLDGGFGSSRMLRGSREPHSDELRGLDGDSVSSRVLHGSYNGVREGSDIRRSQSCSTRTSG